MIIQVPVGAVAVIASGTFTEETEVSIDLSDDGLTWNNRAGAKLLGEAHVGLHFMEVGATGEHVAGNNNPLLKARVTGEGAKIFAIPEIKTFYPEPIKALPTGVWSGPMKAKIDG